MGAGGSPENKGFYTTHRSTKTRWTRGETSQDLLKGTRRCSECRRLALKMSQAELAKRCHVVPGVIQEIEARKGVYDAELINKVLKVLKIQNVQRRYVEH